MRNIGLCKLTPFQSIQDVFGVIPEGDPQVIDQLDFPAFVDTGEERQASECGTALDKRASGIVADAAHNRRANAGRAYDRMGFSPQGAQKAFELAQCRSGQADDLAAILDQMHRRDPQRADDDDVPVVVVAVGGRASREARICSLHQDDLAGGGARLQHSPLLNQGARAGDGQDLAAAKAVAPSERRGASGSRQHMLAANDCPQRCEEAAVHLLMG